MHLPLSDRNKRTGMSSTKETACLRWIGPTSVTSKRALRPFVLRAGFVDGKIAAIEVFAFQGAYRRFAFSNAAHGHKSKSARSACHAIGDEVHISHSSILCE